MGLAVSALAARHGDCLWLEWWRDGDPTVRRLVVDGGTPAAARRLRARLVSLPAGERHLELFVVTHVDNDHIGGALRLLQSPPEGLTVGDVWFNGRRHLPAPRGPRHGELLSSVLDDVASAWRWNDATAGEAVVVTDLARPPVVELAGGLVITVLAPGTDALARLAPVWDRAVEDVQRGVPSPDDGASAPRPRALSMEDLAAAPTRADQAPANGSSIGLLVEHDGRAVLLAGDAHPAPLEAAIRALARARGLDRLPVDLVKLPHHGSRANVTVGLVEALRCQRWLFSTNGDVFGHPDPEAVARVVLHGGQRPILLFNYRSATTRLWGQARLTEAYGYDAVYPARPGGGVRIEL